MHVQLIFTTFSKLIKAQHVNTNMLTVVASVSHEAQGILLNGMARYQKWYECWQDHQNWDDGYNCISFPSWWYTHVSSCGHWPRCALCVLVVVFCHSAIAGWCSYRLLLLICALSVSSYLSTLALYNFVMRWFHRLIRPQPRAVGLEHEVNGLRCLKVLIFRFHYNLIASIF